MTTNNNSIGTTPLPQATEPDMLTSQIREAVRREMSSNYSRKRTLHNYANRLAIADSSVTEFIQQVIRETTQAFRTTVRLYVVSYLVVTFTLVGGLLFILVPSLNNNLSTVAAVAIVVGGVIGLIYLQSHNPVKNVRYMIDNLVKLNVIFAGYIRQIHQVDAVFEDMFTEGREINPAAAEQMLNHLQDAMAEAMSAISQISSEMNE